MLDSLLTISGNNVKGREKFEVRRLRDLSKATSLGRWKGHKRVVPSQTGCVDPFVHPRRDFIIYFNPIILYRGLASGPDMRSHMRLL